MPVAHATLFACFNSPLVLIGRNQGSASVWWCVFLFFPGFFRRFRRHALKGPRMCRSCSAPPPPPSPSDCLARPPFPPTMRGKFGSALLTKAADGFAFQLSTHERQLVVIATFARKPDILTRVQSRPTSLLPHQCVGVDSQTIQSHSSIQR